MGENDVKNENKYCPYACKKKDCDGDWDTYCMKTEKCKYQKKVQDCDRDIIILCRM